MQSWKAVIALVPLMVCLVAPASQAAAGPTPSIDAELTVPGWWVVGPFLTGTREAGVDPLYFAEGAPDFESPLLRPSFPSVLVPGGEARWRYYASGEGGSLSVNYPEVPEASMKLVTDEWGAAGANTVGYAYAKLEVTGGPRRAMMELKGAGMCSINGIPWPGDPYGNGMGMSPVLLNDGVNELKVAFAGDFSLRFLPVGSDLVIFTQSATLPDLVRGEAPPTLIGLPVANTTTDWMTVDTATLNPQGLLGEIKSINVRVPPLCVANLALEFTPAVERIPMELEGDKLSVFLIVNYSGGFIEVMLELGVKNADAPRKVTFRSAMDNSVQYYGLLPPSGFDPAREYGLILTLHGAGVEAIGQVSSYQPKDWAYVVAPTNRRPFGFDWQDWGQRDMLEVLAEVKRNCRIDENRVHLTGHSMGGHGCWLNALTFPGLWATAAPSAGWTRFDLYSPMFLRRNLLYGDPKANYIWQLAMRGDDPLALCENAKNLPIYALEGGADDNVPPQQPRLMVERLKQLGYDITYEEVPGMLHWWDDPTTPGIDCIDSAALNEFWKSHVRKDRTYTYPWKYEFVYRSSSTQIVRGAYRIKVKPERLYEETVIRAQECDNVVVVNTVNANALQIQLSPGSKNYRSFQVMIDGDFNKVDQDILKALIPYLLFTKQDGHWQLSMPERAGVDESSTWTHPRGFKSVLMQPCRVIVPTGCANEETEWCLQMARLYSYQWWYRGNGMLAVLTDVEALADQAWQGTYICLGSPWSNYLRNTVNNDSPIWYGGGELTIGNYSMPGSDVSYKFITPYSYGAYTGLCLVEGGTSLKAMKRLPAMMGIYSGAGFPDWMVWDDEVKLKGMGGVLGMGFFDMNWQIDPELTYFNEDLINRRASGY